MNTLQSIKERLISGQEVFDDEIDFLLKPEYHVHSERHFTSVYVAQLAVDFLTEKGNQHILDIGSGTGKFCFIGGLLSESTFTGIEYRKEFIEEATRLKELAGLSNVNYIQSNIIHLTFDSYDAFYMFNPFLEQIDGTATMDSGLEPSTTLYRNYHHHVAHQLELKPIGTRLVTYYVHEDFIPNAYKPMQRRLQQTLVFWEKME